MEWYIGTEWKMNSKGLRKQVLDIKFTKLEKPHLVSTVVIKVEELQQLQGRPSELCMHERLGLEHQFKLGSAITPVDYYVELLVRQMIVGERSRCWIRTSKDGEEISFVITLEKIIETKETHKLTVSEMYALALRYKENGVAMFKEYPQFAHDYFSRAAKCLISYKPFDSLTLKEDGANGSDLKALFIQLQTNLAACLLTEKRYEHVIYQTQFVETLERTQLPEKALYRRAMAYYHIKEYEAAQQTIEKLSNYYEKPEFAKLHQRIVNSWKTSNDEYKHVVQRMFN